MIRQKWKTIIQGCTIDKIDKSKEGFEFIPPQKAHKTSLTVNKLTYVLYRQLEFRGQNFVTTHKKFIAWREISLQR